MEAHHFKSVFTSVEVVIAFRSRHVLGSGMQEEDIVVEPVRDVEPVSLTRPEGSEPPIFYMYSAFFDRLGV
ncbi:hypothetical protein A2U01_0089493, partial [Trifolium medium]|nr:hypothetical protein [Trifolium medium]